VTRPKQRRVWVQAVIGALVTALLLGALLSLVQWQQLRLLARGLIWPIVVVAAALQWVLYLIRALRFWLLTPQVPFREMAAIAALHILALRIFPLRTGELVYPVLLRRSGEATLTAGLLGLVVLRLLDAVVIVAFFAVALALTHGLGGAGVRHSVVAAAVTAVVGALVVLAFPRLLQLALRLVRASTRIARLAHRAPIVRLMQHVEHAVGAHQQISPRVMGQQAAVTVIHWLINYAMILAVLYALQVDIGFAQAVLGGTAAIVTAFLPIGGIGSFGTLEAGWTLGFVLAGLSKPEAVASGLVYSLVTFFCALVFAGLTWIARPRREVAQPEGTR